MSESGDAFSDFPLSASASRSISLVVHRHQTIRIPKERRWRNRGAVVGMCQCYGYGLLFRE